MSCTDDNTFPLGNTVIGDFTFRDPANSNALVDPSVVKAAVKNPNGTITVYTYGVDVQVVKTAVGTYYVEINANLAGTWHVRGYSTGTYKGSQEESFVVEASEFE